MCLEPYDVDLGTLQQVLEEQGYTRGLVQALATNRQAFALSFWIVDNSGSMQTRDGHRIVEGKYGAGGAFTFVECSRWTELQQTVEYHAQMAAVLHAPTTFRLLNDPGRVAGPPSLSIAVAGGRQNPSTVDQDLAIALHTMTNAQPGGVTPLTQHILTIRETVRALQPQLHQNGTKVVIVLATDGLPTDTQGNSNPTVKEQFVKSLRSLEGLPVWLVVRL